MADFYVKKSQFEYEPLVKEEFNSFLKDIVFYIISENKYMELSLLNQQFKDTCNSEELEIFILNSKGNYKIRNISTYIKKSYGSFKDFLKYNNIIMENMLCVKSK